MELLDNFDKNLSWDIDAWELVEELSWFNDFMLQEIADELELNHESNISNSLIDSLNTLISRIDSWNVDVWPELESKLRFLKEKIDKSQENFLSTELLEWVKRELTPEVANAINQLADKIIKVNNIENNKFFYSILSTISWNLWAYPSLQKLFSHLWEISENKDLDSANIMFQRLNDFLRVSVRSWYFINNQFIKWKSSLLLPILDTKTNDWVLGNLFNKNEYKWISTYIVDDESWANQWYQISWFSVLNMWWIRKLLRFWVENWVYSQEQASNFNLDKIAQATINHESTHFILDEVYWFKARIPIDNSSWWKIDWLDFQPTDTIQIHEFLAHTMWQLTDNYEIMVNIRNTLSNLSQSSLEISWNWDYSLVRAYILKLLIDIFKSKWYEKFDEDLLADWKKINEERNKVLWEIEKAEKNGDNNRKKILINEWESKWIIDYNREFNKLFNKIISSLTPEDYQKINESFLSQSQRYMKKIKND